MSERSADIRHTFNLLVEDGCIWTAHPTDLSLRRCWGLRTNLTIYDAAYVALAEALDADLLTGDSRIAKAPAPTTELSGDVGVLAGCSATEQDDYVAAMP